MASKFEVFSEKFNRGVQFDAGAFDCAWKNQVEQSWDLSWLDGGWNNT